MAYTAIAILTDGFTIILYIVRPLLPPTILPLTLQMVMTKSTTLISGITYLPTKEAAKRYMPPTLPVSTVIIISYIQQAQHWCRKALPMSMPHWPNAKPV